MPHIYRVPNSDVTLRIYNKWYERAPKDAVDIGMFSFWRNRFARERVLRRKRWSDEERHEINAKFEQWLLSPDGAYVLKRIHELKGKDLVCLCYPKQCHGQLLMRLANEG